MDTPTVVALASLVAAIVAAVVAARASNRAALIAAGATNRATDVNEQASNLGWVKELRQDAIDARKEVAELRGEVRELRRQLEAVAGEADHWISRHQTMHRQVWRQGMTIERLRELFGPEPPASPSTR